jgi:hypothetical protein
VLLLNAGQLSEKIPLGVPFIAIEVYAWTILVARLFSKSVRLHVPLGKGRFTVLLNTNGISSVCVAPRSCRTSRLSPRALYQGQVGS